MALTYTHARERRTLGRSTSGAARSGHVALTATALVCALAILLCYAGRIRAFDLTGAAPAGQVVNLADSPSEAQLQSAMLLAYPDADDARFAARELAQALSSGDLGRLANVGTLAQLEVAVSTVERTRGLTAHPERLRQLRAQAAADGSEAPSAVRLFTSTEISHMKPALVVRTRSAHRAIVLWCGLALLLSFQAISLVWQLRGIQGDRLLLAAVHLLVTLGAMAMLSRPDPLRDTLLIVRYTQGVLIGSFLCLAASTIKVRSSGLLQFGYLSLAAALLLSMALVVFGTGPGTSGAKVNLGPWQPVEFIRLLLIAFLAVYLGRRWELLRQVREETWGRRSLPTWLHLPRLGHVLPLFGGVGLALALFFALRDLGPALLISILLLVMLSVARAGAGALAAGLLLLAGGFYLGYALDVSHTLTARVAMWRSPWENAVRGGDQVAQAAWALSAGGLTGTGPGLGDTRYVPAGHTDLVLAAVGEELGLVGLLVVLAAAAVLAWRGLGIARRAPTDTAFFLALGLTLSLVLPMIVMAAGTLGLMPLTGLVTPFLSYGGSAMLANLLAVGLLAAIGSASGAPIDVQPFRSSLRWVAAGLAACAVVVVASWTDVQAVSADQVLVRPQLSRQADGGLRYQYNPRVLDAARLLPRGVIRDRREIPLAADAATLQHAAAEFERMHVSIAEACAAASGDRCYPLGGRAFHLLGDAGSRLNWAATNSSYVERDAQGDLRGFDDRAAVVEAGESEGSRMLTLRRDFRDLVPLVRHRWAPDHEAVVAIRDRPRDVELTIDARLQMQVSSILVRAAASAGVQKAAVVVVDVATGELLASVSHPWPDVHPHQRKLADDSLLDRARYGLYPPGSTFKLVTTAAALRLDPGLDQLAFTCSRLPDGRVGARIPGYGRPIRDDVRDHQPHGTLTLREALVQSCNAYFAQLAVRLGTEPLAQTATGAGLVFPSAGEPARLRENLPHAGYGQGEVLATPLRMARIAAAIASDGMMREPSIVRDGTPPAPRPFLPTASARLLAGYMREAVTGGSGRALRGHAVPIAGKTGTAQVDGATSHSWFVGFAPARPDARRIAFAVLLENAGYGGAAAATVAGQVVTAAASLELLR